MDKMRRFVDVQRQLQRAAERTLHDLRHEEDRLRQAQEEVFAALNRGDESGIALAPLLTRRLARLVNEAGAAAEAGDRQVDVVLRQASRLKHAERVERALRAEEDRAHEKMALGDLLDVIVGGRAATVR